MTESFGILQIIGSFSNVVSLATCDENVFSFSFSLAEDISNCGQLSDLSLCSVLGLEEPFIAIFRRLLTLNILHPKTFFTSRCTLFERKAYKMGENMVLQRPQIKARSKVHNGGGGFLL